MSFIFFCIRDATSIFTPRKVTTPHRTRAIIFIESLINELFIFLYYGLLLLPIYLNLNANMISNQIAKDMSQAGFGCLEMFCDAAKERFCGTETEFLSTSRIFLNEMQLRQILRKMRKFIGEMGAVRKAITALRK